MMLQAFLTIIRRFKGCGNNGGPNLFLCSVIAEEKCLADVCSLSLSYRRLSVIL